MTDVYGILLAGGLARRMGGGDKGLTRIAGHTIIDRVIAIMRPQCAGLVLNANGETTRLARFSLPIVTDDVPGFAGPLAGILAGLDWLAAQGREHAYAVSVPTDTPFLPYDLVTRLAGARSSQGARLACATSGGHTHPVVGLWPIDIRLDLRAALVDEDIRRIDRFTARYATALADWPAVPIDPFFNANEPRDVEQAEVIATAFKRDEG